jgi:hypothetical protein
MDRRDFVINITALTRVAKLLQLPIVLSTVKVKAKGSEPTIHQLRELLPDVPEIAGRLLSQQGKRKSCPRRCRGSQRRNRRSRL